MRGRFLPVLAAVVALTLVACEEDDRGRTPTQTSTPPVSASPAPDGGSKSGEASPPAAGSGVPGAPPGATPPPSAGTRTPPDRTSPDAVVTSPPQPEYPQPTPTPRLETPAATPPPLEPGRVREPAPIEAVSARLEGSAGYLDVTSGLPGGCARFDYVSVERVGGTISVTLWNTMPADPNVACTAIYGYVLHTVPLGKLEPGRYEVRVHDRSATLDVP